MVEHEQELPTNTLYYGDNLDILRRYVANESVDLIYLDPPFKSNQDYNVLFKEKNGKGAAAQILAFEDTWTWNPIAAAAYQEVVESGGRASSAMQAFRTMLGTNDMLAYLAMMAPRLMELRRVLHPTGSIYLHCDPTASHYLKMLMDAIFDVRHFRNEIIWHYRRWTAPSKKFQRLHDVILFYTKENVYTFNLLLTPYTKGSVERKEQGVLHRFKKGEEPVLVSDGKVQAEGVPENDVWHIPFVAPSAKERLGYPTQKPETLLERIIKASSNEGDVVLDPFCGCGTAIAAATHLNRQWIGIDITHLSINLIKHRLQDAFRLEVDKDYVVIGEPVSLPDAEQLAAEDPMQFQLWVLGLVYARPAELKRGADQGIDGQRFFHDEGPSGPTKHIVFSVKAGHTGVKDVRDLRGVVEREKAAIGVLLCLQIPTQPMISEAASAGFYKSPWGTQHQRLQILTVEQLFEGAAVDLPHTGDERTFRKAKRIQRGKKPRQENLEF